MSGIPKEVTIYAAGFFDGEGSVFAAHKSQQLRATIVQVDRSPLDFIAGFYGGRVTYRTNKYNGYHELVLLGDKAKQFLTDIYEYCIVKRADIRSAYEYLGLSMESLD